VFKITKIFAFAMISVFLVSCEKENPGGKNYLNGVFIVNEGAFGSNNASISWYNSENKSIENNIFETVNNRPLGDVVQSIGTAGSYGFIVVNNSQKVEVVNLKDFSSRTVITDLSYPRHFAANESHVFISNGNFEGTVIVIDLTSMDKIDEIDVGFGPEQMAVVHNHLYVANSGGWGFDNRVSVIDLSTRQVIDHIEVGDNPFALQKDYQNNLWVLCRGKVVYDFDTWEIVEETDSKLLKINTSDNTVVSTTVIGSTGDFFWPSLFVPSGDKNTMYFNETGGIYSLNVLSGLVSATPVLEGNFSGLGVHPLTGEFFTLKTPNYNSSGTLEIYNSEGQITGEFPVGIGPNMVVFKI
jgi:YVTN family beta-propeller protein